MRKFLRVDRSPEITHGYFPQKNYLDHQTVGLEKLSALPEAAFLMDYGTGKSFMTVTNTGELAAGGEITGAVIIAPKGNYEDWTLKDPETSHWTQNANPEWLERINLAQWRGGHSAAEKDSFSAIMSWSGFSILVVNSEALSASGRAEKLISEFLSSRRCLIAFDESTHIKSPSAARTKAAIRLAQKAAYRRILTGFPTPKSSMDLYSQFLFLNWRILGHRSFYSFRAQYATLGTIYLGQRSVQTITGYKNTSQLWEKIEPYSHRVLADECLDLPERIYKVKHTEMTNEQRRIYNEVRDNCLSQVGEAFVSTTMVLTQILRLHQIACGFVVTESGEEVELPCRKIDDTVELVDEIGEQKTVIWANYRTSIRQLGNRLRKEFGERCVVEYHGGTSDSDRTEAKKRFAEDPDCRFFLSTQAVGGRGLNDLIVARNTIYYANSLDLELRLNSEARTRRKGSERHDSVVYTDVITEGTVEPKIVQALRKKLDLASLVTADGPRQWLV